MRRRVGRGATGEETWREEGCGEGSYSVPAGDAGESRTAVELSTMSVEPDSARMRSSSDSRSLPPRAPIVQIAAAAGWAGCELA
mgnify:CR=1 FL=1